MPQQVVNMSVEECGTELFGEYVSHVDGGVNTFELDQISLDPFEQDIILNVHVPCPWRGFLCIGHYSAGIIILIEDGCRILWDAQIPHDTADK